GNVAYVLRDNGRLRMAAQRVLAMAPSRPEGFTLRALWQRRQGDLAGALDMLNKAVEHRGTETDPLMLRGLVLQEMGRIEEARQSYASVLAQDPMNEAAKSAIGTLVAGVAEGESQR